MADYNPAEGSDKQSDEDYGKPTTELDNDALMLRFKDWWRQDLPRSKAWHTAAIEAFKFRAGEQWDDEDKEIMEDAQKRACLEFNQIDPVIDAVAGTEVTNRQEVRYIPRTLGAAQKNEILTEGARWFRDECNAEHEDSAAFTDAATAGMGWTETRLDYEENPDGDPKIERVDPLEMVWDYAAKQTNLKDARRVMRVASDLPLDEARAKWPKDMDGNAVDDADYDATWAADVDEAGAEVPYKVHFPGEERKHDTDEAREDRTVTVVQVQWYEREPFYRAMMLDPTTGQHQMAELSVEEHLTAGPRAEQIGQIYKAVQQVRRVYYKAFVGNRVLEITKMEGPSGNKAGSFSLQCITAKWDRNKGVFYGLVRSMMGPQKFANKWLSTAVEIMARGAKGGLMLEEGAVVDVEDFEDEWSKPGTNAYFRPGALSGQKVQPKPPASSPTDLMGMTQFAIASIRDVTGVNTETLAMGGSMTGPGGPDTASQEYQRRQGATIILAPLFDSLRLYRRITGRHLLWLITEFLSDGRLVRIVGQEGEQYVPLIHEPGTVKFDVIVDDAPTAPSQKEMVWKSLVTMMPLVQAMNPPPEVIMILLEYSPFPASVVAKIKAVVQQAQQNAQPQPSPMDLIMMEKQAGIQEEQQKSQIRLDAKKQENALDLEHSRAKIQIDLQGRIAQARIAAWAKQHEAEMLAAGQPQAANPMDLAVHEGMAEGMKAGVQRVATEVAAGEYAKQMGLPVGPPTHISNVAGVSPAPEPAGAGGGSAGGGAHVAQEQPGGGGASHTIHLSTGPDHTPAIADLSQNVHSLVQHLSTRKMPRGFKRTPEGMQVVYDEEKKPA